MKVTAFHILQGLLMFSLRKLFWFVFPVTILLLGSIVLLGARQYAVSGKYSTIINENEKAIFHFATVREAVTEALIIEDTLKLINLIPVMEEFHSIFVNMQENPYVPAELKLSLIDKIDITGVIIELRKIGSGQSDGIQKNMVQEEMRNIATHLLKYDRILAAHARSRTHSLQLIIIGSMGIVISMVSFSLILLYRNSIIPMLNLTEQLENDNGSHNTFQLTGHPSLEATELAKAIQRRVEKAIAPGLLHGEAFTSDHHPILAKTINESTNQLNGLINYTQLLADTEPQDYSSEQKNLLDKILETGVAISRSWQKLQ